ncbi:MAG: hypothetical protein MZV70_30515 [Desulfobacterales bacterium]|nr:hypothetical protein [Desulfobacterales bacterium]
MPGTISAEEIGAYLKKRRSVRHFTEDPVPKEKIIGSARYRTVCSIGR